MQSGKLYHILFIILLLLLTPSVLKAQAYWEFQLPPLSKCSLESFSTTPDSCRTISSCTNGYFYNTCKDASQFQDSFVIDNGNTLYKVYALNELSGKCIVNRLKKKIRVCKCYKGFLNGEDVLIYTDEIWYFSAKERARSCTPLNMSVRIKTAGEWINAGFNYARTKYKKTRIYYR